MVGFNERICVKHVAQGLLYTSSVIRAVLGLLSSAFCWLTHRGGRLQRNDQPYSLWLYTTTNPSAPWSGPEVREVVTVPLPEMETEGWLCHTSCPDIVMDQILSHASPQKWLSLASGMHCRPSESCTLWDTILAHSATLLGSASVAGWDP